MYVVQRCSNGQVRRERTTPTAKQRDRVIRRLAVAECEYRPEFGV
jgi:hypothetical protein